MRGDKERLEDELVKLEGDLFDATHRVGELEDELAGAEYRITELEAELAPLAQMGITVK